MKIKEIFDLAIKIGLENDPRGEEKAGKVLKKRKEEFEELPEKRKGDYDQERLVNPYPDSGIHFGDPEKEVKRVLVGIDIDAAEVLLANELSKNGKKIDLIISHHPIGKSLANLHDVMDMQVDILASEGVPANIAEKIMDERSSQVGRNIAPINHFQAVDAAKLLDIPIMNIHTPADNSVDKFVRKEIADKKPETVGEIILLLKEIPEYAEAVKLGSGPTIFSGSERSRSGKIIMGMTGGTGNSDKIYEKLGQYGIGTVVDMHIGEKHREEAAKHFINVLIAGHISSDSLGLNIIMDELQKRGVEIVPCSGYLRHSRV